MATIENVTAARLLVCNLKGDIRYLTRTVTIRESICSPYLTGELLVLDNQNVIIDREVRGGDRVDISFDAPDGKKYTVDMYVLDIKGVSSPENMMLKIYTISVVSSEYFTDYGHITSQTTPTGMTGVDLVKKIWGEEEFKTPLVQPATDAPLRDGNQPFHVDFVRPLTAIGQIRDIQVYPSFPTGNVLLYRDNKAVNHVPLQYIYETCRPMEEYIQRETWGIMQSHLFGGDRSFHTMMQAAEHTRATMLDPRFYENQGKRGYDAVMGKLGLDKLVGDLGAGLNMTQTNSDRTSAGIDFTGIMDKARWYALYLKSLPQYLVKVPLRTGLNSTAGKGCRLEFTPMHTKPNSPNPATGTYLVTDLIHEVHNDLRVVNGTTTLQCLQGIKG